MCFGNKSQSKELVEKKTRKSPLNACPICCANRATSWTSGGVTHLQGAVDHANDVVELLMVQNGSVLLNVEAELIGETLASRFTFERAQSSWQRLPRGGRNITNSSRAE